MYPEGKMEARIEGIEFIKLNVALQTEVKSLFGEEDVIKSQAWVKILESNSETVTCHELRTNDREVFMSTSLLLWTLGRKLPNLCLIRAFKTFCGPVLSYGHR